MRNVTWACVAALLVTGALRAEDKAVALKVGDDAPVFESVDDTGEAWKSEDHVGKHIVVVYFYPADCTGGCTAQAKGFRDDAEKLKAKGVEVVGVSADSVENHKIFKKVESLNFTLLADPEGKLAKAFGVPFTAGEVKAKTKVDGEEITLLRKGTAKRWTIVIGKDKKILLVNSMVKAAEDSKAVLKLVEDIQ